MRDGVHHEMAQREGVGLQGPLAAPRAVRTAERRVTGHAPLRAGNRYIDVREHHRRADSMPKGPHRLAVSRPAGLRGPGPGQVPFPGPRTYFLAPGMGLVSQGSNRTFGPSICEHLSSVGPSLHPHQFCLASTVPPRRLATPMSCLSNRELRCAATVPLVATAMPISSSEMMF